MSGFILAFIGSTLLSAAAVYFYIQLAYRRKLFDHANKRSMHENYVPRGAGIAFVMVAILVSFVAWNQAKVNPLYPLIFAILLLLFIGAIDDIRRGPEVDGLPVMLRIIMHFVCATIVVLAYSRGSMLWSVLMVLAIVWWINLTNFMDGIDGIAGGFAIIVHGFLAYWAFTDGDTSWFIFNVAMMAAILGFIFFNWPPAKVFMGDSGSTVLGLTMSIAGLKGSTNILDVMPFTLLSLPFWFDATITLIVRKLKGETLWQAHRSHIYQRIVTHQTTPNRLPVVAVTLIYMSLSFILGLIASIIR